MSLIITAYAASTSSQGSGSSTLLMITVMIAIFYFLLIRPESRHKNGSENKRSAKQRFPSGAFESSKTSDPVDQQNCPQKGRKMEEERQCMFCNSCGKQIEKGIKFCPACGTPTNKENVSADRKTVFDGKIHKCPSCGEVINSFVAICPACGFELREKEVSSSLQDFIEKISESEKLIANNPQKSSSGWSSWNNAKKIGWVLLNVYSACIPILIRSLLPYIRKKHTPNLTREEKLKASIIENFPFPNDRESILAALIYVREKINFISQSSVNKKTAYWVRLWQSKAEQLKSKADILIPNDGIVRDTYEEICTLERQIRKAIKAKVIMRISVVVIPIVLLITSALIFGEPTANEFSAPDDFVIGYELADYTKYNSPASENGLGGSNIYFYCTLDKTELVAINGINYILGYATDDLSNDWLVLLNAVPVVSETTFDRYIGEKMVIRGAYDGFAEAKGAPLIVLDEMLIQSTGEKLMGLMKVL